MWSFLARTKKSAFESVENSAFEAERIQPLKRGIRPLKQGNRPLKLARSIAMEIFHAGNLGGSFTNPTQ